MTTRIVLGTGRIGTTILDGLSGDRDDLVVVTADEHWLDTLRSDGLSVEASDPTDPATLSALDRSPDSVLVVDDDPETNVGAARAASEVFPDSLLVAYAGTDPSDEALAALEDCTDHVVDPAAAVAADLLETAGDDGVRLRQLKRVLRDVDGQLAVVTHDNPDPDAIASAVALVRIAETVGLDADVCYYGDISHQENRAFVNLLEFDLRTLDPEDEAPLAEYGGVALVDHSQPGINDKLPPETPVDVVIDHHPPRVPVEARFVDLRSDVGATSTLLAEYLRRSGRAVDWTVATGLIFGILVDTKEFRREVSAIDFEAAAYLLPHADLGALKRFEQPSVGADTFDTLARAIRNRIQEGSVVMSCVGELTDRDALAQAADRLLDLEGINATLVYGVRDDTIYVSARARGTDVDLGATLRDAFGQIGSAGGHADMAGAQITMGVLEAIEDRDESLHEVVRSVVDDRFLEALQSRSNRLLSDVDPGAYLSGDGNELERF